MIGRHMFLGTLLALLLHSPAHPDETSTNQYNLGVIGLAPYAIPQKDGSHTGYMVEMAREIRKLSTFPGSDDVLPLKRLHGYLSSGKMDCSIMARVHHTESLYDMVVPIGKQIKSAIVARSGITLNSYDDLKGLTIAVPAGVTLDKKFLEDQELNKFPTSGYQQSTKMLQHGRVDAMIGVWDSYLYNMRNVGMSRDEIGAPLILNQVPVWFMCRRDFKNDVVKTKLSDVIADLRDRGVFSGIIAKYLGDIQ